MLKHQRLFRVNAHNARSRIFNAPTCRFITSDTEATSPIPEAATSKYFFDTLQFAENLEKQGLTKEQAEAILQNVTFVIQDSVDTMKQSLMSKQEQERLLLNYKSDFSHLKAEINLLEKNDFAILKQENERLVGEVEKLKSKVREDLQKLQSSMRLDMNLDKARIRDEQNLLILKINESQAKMEQETTQLNASIDNVKFDTIKAIGATATSIGIVILGWARYFKN